MGCQGGLQSPCPFHTHCLSGPATAVCITADTWPSFPTQEPATATYGRESSPRPRPCTPPRLQKDRQDQLIAPTTPSIWRTSPLMASVFIFLCHWLCSCLLHSHPLATDDWYTHLRATVLQYLTLHSHLHQIFTQENRWPEYKSTSTT